MNKTDITFLGSALLLLLIAGGCILVWPLSGIRIEQSTPALLRIFLDAQSFLFRVVTIQWWILSLGGVIGGYGILHWLTRFMREEGRAQTRDAAHAGMAALFGVHFLGGLLVMLLDGVFDGLRGLPQIFATLGLLACLVTPLLFALQHMRGGARGAGAAFAVGAAVLLGTAVLFAALPRPVLRRVDMITRVEGWPQVGDDADYEARRGW